MPQALRGTALRVHGRNIWELCGEGGGSHRPSPKGVLAAPTPAIPIRLTATTVGPRSLCPEVLPLLQRHCCDLPLGVFRCQLRGQESEKFRQARSSHAARRDPWAPGFHRTLPAR